MPKLRLLLVEDEEVFARAVTKRLKQTGYDCELAQTLADGRALIKQFQPDLVLLDMRLPDGNGLDLLHELTSNAMPVIVITAYGDVSDAVNVMKQGAIDYLKKPVDLEELLLVLEKTQRTVELRNRVDYSRERDQLVVEGIQLLGKSVAMSEVRAKIEQIARLPKISGAIPPTVLITGETGTGKDVVARMLHQLMFASERPFVQVDCSSLPADLIENELFGHEKGAFTNAQSARCGLIEAAEDGTLFLDEVGELPLALQTKLLSVLERRVVRRIGSTKERPVSAHFIAATNRDLQQMVEDGRFRADLFYRLHVLSINMPPLRERLQDVQLLAQYFLKNIERRYGLTPRALSPQATQMMEQYDWPGNVRELKHLTDRAALLSKQEIIDADDLGFFSPPKVPTSSTLGELDGLTIEAAERLLIENALRSSAGNVSLAARKLDLSRMAMRYRMEKYGLKSSA